MLCVRIVKLYVIDYVILYVYGVYKNQPSAAIWTFEKQKCIMVGITVWYNGYCYNAYCRHFGQNCWFLYKMSTIW